MSPNGKLPLDGMYAYHRKKDNSIHLASDNEFLKDIDFQLEKKLNATTYLREVMEEEGIINKSLDSLLKGFVLMGISHASYESGLTLVKIQKNDSLSRLKIPEQYFPLRRHQAAGGHIHVGIDCEKFAIVGVGGEAGSGRSTFVKNLLPAEVTTYLDFASINYGAMSSYQKENFGNSTSQEFLRDPYKKFFVVDHYSLSRQFKNLNFHPTLYFDTFRQIAEHAKLFRKGGKTLVITGVTSEGVLENAQADTYIELLGNNLYMNYGFSFAGIDFPKIPVE